MSVNTYSSLSVSQIKYKESGKKDMSTSLYSLLPETTEIQFAREMTEMQSEVAGHIVNNFCFGHFSV